MADLGKGFGSEQGGFRPVVIIQNDVGNHYSPTVIVAALTSRVKDKARLPTHFLLRGLTQGPSLVLCEQLRTLDKRRLGAFLGRVSPREMEGVDQGLRASLGLDHPPPERNKAPFGPPLVMNLCPACADNFRWDGRHSLKQVDPSARKDLCTFCGQRYGRTYQVYTLGGRGQA